MKHHHLSILLLFLLGLTASAQTDSINLGNCTKKVVLYETLDSKNAPGGSALFYPAETMQKYAGCNITDIVLFPSNWKSITSLRVFLSKSLTEPFDYVQEVTLDHGNWVNVRLNTPYVLDGGELYIGYLVKGTTNLVYTTPKEKGKEYICLGPNKGWQVNENGYSAALYAVVRDGDNATLPVHNARLKNVIYPPCAVMDKPLNVQVTIGNLGLSTIESLSVCYHVGNHTYNQEINGLNIAAADEQTLTLTCPAWEEEGEHDFTITLTSVNGKSDADISDNTSQKAQMICRKHFEQRNLLLETFSTERCTECPQAHYVLHEVCNDNRRIIELGHHAGFYDDAFTLPESQDYEWFYKPSVLYAPAVMLDRTNFHDIYPQLCDAETPIGHPEANRLTTLMEYALSVPAYATIDMQAATDEARRTATLTVNCQGILPYQGDARLFVFVSEDSVHSTTQAGSGGSFYHRHVARQSLTPTWGTTFDWQNGTSLTYHITLPDTWQTKQLRAVAFVAGYDENNRNNCQVLNTATASLNPLVQSGIAPSVATASAGKPIRLANGFLLPAGAHLKALHTTDGRQIQLSESHGYVNMSTLPKGTYLLTFGQGNIHNTCKVIY